MIKKFGFTLIELMVTIAIIGILASIAVPTYKNYVIRARVTEGLNLAMAAKTAVNEAISANEGRLSDDMGKDYKGHVATENVKSIVITPTTGDVTITFTEKAGDGTMVLHPVVSTTGDITWQCKEGSLDAKYRPSSCR